MLVRGWARREHRERTLRSWAFGASGVIHGHCDRDPLEQGPAGRDRGAPRDPSGEDAWQFGGRGRDHRAGGVSRAHFRRPRDRRPGHVHARTRAVTRLARFAAAAHTGPAGCTVGA